MNNFRGFKDTLIPLKDVNFLVGENSTGKTSFLKLLELFSEESFWTVGTEAKVKEVLGDFYDNVSVESEDRSYFVVGWIQHETNVKKNDSIVANYILLMFKNLDGKPIITALDFHTVKNQITMLNIDKKSRSNDVLVKITEPSKITAHQARAKINDFVNKYRKEPDISNFKNLKQKLSNTNRFPQDVFKYNFPLTLFLSLFDSPYQEFLSNSSIWFAPIRSKPLKTYEGAVHPTTREGGHTPFLLQSILNKKVKAAEFHKSLKEFGFQSGLFNDVKINKLGEGRFEVQIILENKPLNIMNVGYGVSQILPIIVEMLGAPRETIFGIQQPEVHLHPKAQASLGDLIFQFATVKKHRYIIETHSDFLIDRFRIARRNSRRLIDSQIIFFERKDGNNYAASIAIDKKGVYEQCEATRSYKEFFLNEAFKKLEI